VEKLGKKGSFVLGPVSSKERKNDKNQKEITKYKKER